MPTWVPSTVTAKAVFAAGFAYDPDQDIIYSRMNAWQRNVGYCWAYDVLAPGLNFIIDCEPICFTHDGATWMIELWKGQYAIETGAEIGVYRTGEGVMSTVMDYMNTGGKIGSIVYETGKRVAAGLAYRAHWYRCADDFDIQKLELSFALKRKGQLLVLRGTESHWWLTGFKWGEFTEETSDLTMEVTIRFKNEPKMQYAFTDALWKMGYQPITWDKHKVYFEFKNPKTPQPSARSWSESRAQLANKILVVKYKELKAALGVEKNDPNKFDIRDATDKAYNIFAPYYNKIWHSRR